MPNSSPPVTSSKTAPTVRLQVRGLGHVPSKKNRLFARADGGVMTDSKVRQWSTRCIAAFVSQLCCGSATGESAILTTEQLRSLTQLLPADDGWKHIPEIHLTAIQVPKGDEGADITIELLP